MIVKNEAKQLPRCLASIKNYIDTYCIVDTGSTDNTIDVIKSELSNIKGEIIERPWLNFGHNRTESLQYAKGKADYLLLCDADEQITFSKDFKKEDLTQSQYLLKYDGNMDYRVPYLIKGNLDWSYVGVTHEFLSCSGKFVPTNLDTITIHDYGDGGSKHDKFERDIKLLEKGLIDEPNNVRYMFYLANSYRDVGNNHKAIKWYDKRIKAGGWREEIACAYEYQGICYERIGDQLQAIDIWLQGFEFNPIRVECLYNAIRLLRLRGKYITAYQLLKKAKEIPYPSNDILFIKKNIYKYELDYEESVLSWYGDKDKDVRSLFHKLLLNENPKRSNVISNYSYYCKSIDNIADQIISLGNLIDDIPGYHNSSASIIPHKDDYLLNIRRVSYEMDKKGTYFSYGLKPPQKINTLNTQVKLSKSLDKVWGCIDYEEPNINKLAVNGLEDVRILETPKGIHFNANIWNAYGDIKVVEGRYNSTQVLAHKQLKSPLNRGCEKNWSPFLYHNMVKYIYDWNPIIIGHTSNNEFLIDKPLVTKLPGVRGGSPGFLHQGMYWFLVHTVKYGEPRNYYHSIVRINADTLEYVDHSLWFTFEGKKIEFGLGLIVEDDRILMTYSTWDRVSKLGVYDKDKLLKFIY